jgi:hypothetical protein
MMVHSLWHVDDWRREYVLILENSVFDANEFHFVDCPCDEWFHFRQTPYAATADAMKIGDGHAHPASKVPQCELSVNNFVICRLSSERHPAPQQTGW